MGLPTSIPSGGDGRDRFSQPLPDPALSSALPAVDPEPVAIDPEQAEFEEFLRWKRERGATASQTPSPARTQAPRTSTDPRRARAPQALRQEIDHTDSLPTDDDGRWTVDPKTGKRYKSLAATPKEALAAYGRTKGAGLTLDVARAMIEVEEDFDIDDLNGTAETFMAHLRVPPSPAEREAILRKKAELVERQRAERAAIDAQLNEKEGSLDEPESDPFNENPPKKRGRFGRKN